MAETPLADLHTHTDRSDGVLTPTQLVGSAVDAGLAVLAVTDHDTTAGVSEAIAAAAGTALEVVPGIEISSRSGKREVHLLGLFIDPHAAPLAELSQCQRRWRRERAETMIVRAAKLGLDIDLARVDAAAGGAPIGRPHMAQVLVDAGEVGTSQEAFDRYLGMGRPCTVPKQMIATVDAITAVHDAGGVAVVAHPGSSRVHDRLLSELAGAGLDGAEVVHPRHGAQRRRLVAGLCERLGLLPSGGSDYHGPGRGDSRLGAHGIPLQWVEELRLRAATRQAAEG